MQCKGIFAPVDQINSKKQKAVRLVALLLCVLYLTITLLSAAYLLIHVNHAHDSDGVGGHCNTCNHMILAENVLNTLLGATRTFGIALSAFVLILRIYPRDILIEGCSLVCMKVRMNN